MVYVGHFYERLGEMKANALLGWFTFHGIHIHIKGYSISNINLISETDMTGGFAGKGIISHFEAFLAADNDILITFSQFGETRTISQFIIEQVERYVCYLYAKTFTKNIRDKTKHSVRSTMCLCFSMIQKKITDLRYALVLQDGKEGEQLPPTLGTLIPHLKRAYYMALIWNGSIQSSCRAFKSLQKGYGLFYQCRQSQRTGCATSI